MPHDIHQSQLVKLMRAPRDLKVHGHMHSSTNRTLRLGILRSMSSSVILLPAISAHAATVWNGPTISFTKTNYANPLLAQNQDRLTANVWITRGSSQGLFNAK